MTEWWSRRVTGVCDSDGCARSPIWEAEYRSTVGGVIYQWCDRCFSGFIRDNSINILRIGLSEADFWKELYDQGEDRLDS